MRRAAVCTLVVAALAAGCRGVLGIEPLELEDASTKDAQSAESSAGEGAAGEGGSGEAATNDSGASDTGVVDSAADVDAGSVTDGSVADVANDYSSCVSQGSNCRPCCKTTYNGAAQLLTNDMIEAGCICGSGQCADAATCEDYMCSGSPTQPSQACAMCTDMAILPPPPTPPTQPCNQAIQDCKNDPACANAIDCLQACP